MDALQKISRRVLQRVHLEGTPLGEILPEAAIPKLLAPAKSEGGFAQALLIDETPVGYMVVSDDGEVMMHIHPSFAGKGIATAVLTRVVEQAKKNRQRLWAKARHGSAGGRLARRAGMIETSTAGNEVVFEAFVSDV